MDERRRLGSSGERAARRYLRRRGWRIVATNLRAGAEIDLIAERAGVVIGCEVKTRHHDAGDGRPRVSHAQRARLAAALEAFVVTRELACRRVRLDLLLVHPGRFGMRVRHLPGALDDETWSASKRRSAG